MMDEVECEEHSAKRLAHRGERIDQEIDPCIEKWWIKIDYDLRSGDYRVLFEVIEIKIIIYRIKHRKDAYK
jgi:hypothetical protein